MFHDLSSWLDSNHMLEDKFIRNSSVNLKKHIEQFKKLLGIRVNLGLSLNNSTIFESYISNEAQDHNESSKVNDRFVANLESSEKFNTILQVTQDRNDAIIIQKSLHILQMDHTLVVVSDIEWFIKGKKMLNKWIMTFQKSERFIFGSIFITKDWDSGVSLVSLIDDLHMSWEQFILKVLSESFMLVLLLSAILAEFIEDINKSSKVHELAGASLCEQKWDSFLWNILRKQVEILDEEIEFTEGHLDSDNDVVDSILEENMIKALGIFLSISLFHDLIGSLVFLISLAQDNSNLTVTL